MFGNREIFWKNRVNGNGRDDEGGLTTLVRAGHPSAGGPGESVQRSLKAAPQTRPAGAYLLREPQADRAGDGADPGVHLFFVLEEVAKRGLTEDVIDGYLHGAP